MTLTFKGTRFHARTFIPFVITVLSLGAPYSFGQIRVVAPAAAGTLTGIFGRNNNNKKNGQNDASPPRGSNTLSNEEKNDGWQLLFDGKTMTGWHTFNKVFLDGKWEVRDGTIHLLDRDKSGLSTSHDIVTDSTFGDFDFKAGWKVAQATNSGIMIHVQEGPNYDQPHKTGPEMQVLDNQGNPNGQLNTGRAGALFGLLPCIPDNAKPPGQWNEVEIICKGGVLQLFQNGANVVTTTLWDENWNRMIAASAFSKFPDYGSYKTGKINLQDMAGEVWFTNIKIKRLDAGYAPSGSVAVNTTPPGQGTQEAQPPHPQNGPAQMNAVAPGQAPDLTGEWQGVLNIPGMSALVERYFQKTGDGMYSGITILHWRKNGDNTPYLSTSPAIRTVKKVFVGQFDGQVYNNIEIDTIESTPTSGGMLGTGKEKFVNENGTPELRLAGTGPATTLRFISPTFPERFKKYLVSESTFRIDNVDYTTGDKSQRIRYNDRIQVKVSVSNGAAVNFRNLTARLTTEEADNGLENYKDLVANFSLGRISDRSYGIRLLTNFAVPPDSLHFTLTISAGDVDIAKKSFAVATDPFYKTDKVLLPEVANARLKAVANYYGSFATPYADVAPPLNNIAVSGDKLALMWKAIFLYKGYGGYKPDESQAAALARQVLNSVENAARAGDAEALYLMFYACQLGFEGRSAMAYAQEFLKKSANAGFKPAVYDYALIAHQRKNYETAYTYFVKSIGMGERKAASNIGTMYEGGYFVEKNMDSAVTWYQRGIAFGDPAAMVNMALLVSAGYGDAPPDINKALELAARAAEKGYAPAMIFCGNVFMNGRQGKPQNIATAIKWFKQAAEFGNADGMLRLGVCYMADNIPGAAKDEPSAYFWVKKSAEAGNPSAMNILAKFYLEGTVTDKNVIKGRYWRNQAVLRGAATMERKDMEQAQEDMENFWRSADFSPSYVYVEDGDVVGDSGPDFFGGVMSGLFSTFMQRYSHLQELINGLEFIQQKNGYKIYGGTVSSFLQSNLNLRQGQTISVKAYGIISTGMMSGSANADGLGDAWAEYRIVPTIPCSAMMGGVKDTNWQFIGQSASYTAPTDGPMMFALNAIDSRNYKGYFDVVVQVPVD